MSGFETRGGRARVRRRVARGRRRASTGRRSTSTAARRSRRPTAAYDAAFAAVPHRDLLRGEGQRQRGDPAPARGARRRRRHRLGRRAARGAAGRLPAGADRLRRRRQDATPRSRSGSSTGSASGTPRARTRSRGIGAAAAARGTRARVSLRVNPDIDAALAPLHLDRACARPSSASTSPRAPAILRAGPRAGRGRGRRACSATSARRSPRLEPLAAAARALAGLSRQLLDEGFALAHDRHRRRPRRELRRQRACRTRRALAAAVAARARGPAADAACSSRAARSWPAAGALLTRVLYVKEGHGKRFVVVDAGMNDLLRPALYEAFHRIEPVRSRGRARPSSWTWSGPSARRATSWPAAASSRPSSRATCSRCATPGAYAFSMSSNYNMRPRAAEVLVEDGRARADPPPRDLRRPGPDRDLSREPREAERARPLRGAQLRPFRSGLRLLHSVRRRRDCVSGLPGHGRRAEERRGRSGLHRGGGLQDHEATSRPARASRCSSGSSTPVRLRRSANPCRRSWTTRASTTAVPATAGTSAFSTRPPTAVSVGRGRDQLEQRPDGWRGAREIRAFGVETTNDSADRARSALVLHGRRRLPAASRTHARSVRLLDELERPAGSGDRPRRRRRGDSRSHALQRQLQGVGRSGVRRVEEARTSRRLEVSAWRDRGRPPGPLGQRRRSPRAVCRCGLPHRERAAARPRGLLRDRAAYEPRPGVVRPGSRDARRGTALGLVPATWPCRAR